MFGNRSFLVLGGDNPADIKSLISGGYEAASCRWGFRQGVGANGKAEFRQPIDYKNQPQHELQGGQIMITLTQIADMVISSELVKINGFEHYNRWT